MNKSGQTRLKRSVRSLERGLALLQLVNEEGGVKPTDAAKLLRMPRPTVHRLLETLEELGFVRRSASDNRFIVTIEARRLSGGYDTDVRLSETVAPVLSNLLRDLVWPVNIMTYRDGMMVIRETTHERSPLAVDRDMIGVRCPILRTASGRVYLAHCSDAERREIIQYIRMINDPLDAIYLKHDALEKTFAQCRQNGYGERFNEGYMSQTSSIAVPILVGERARGCIAILWATPAMSVERALRDFVAPLKDAAQIISNRLQDMPGFCADVVTRESPSQKGDTGVWSEFQA